MTGAPTLDALGLPVDEVWLNLYDLDLMPAGNWPRLHTCAFHGLAGEVVRLLAPASEADPAGLLLTFLAFFGNAVGPGPHAFADGAEHPARLNVVLVGDTSRSRKGTTAARISALLQQADPGWSDNCIKSGFGSAEALVDEICDDKEGVDKRLLVLEGEYVRLLAVAAREGSILSAQIRDAWDLKRLAVRSRHKRAVSTGAHVSFVSHITIEELRRRLSETEMANGMANRFLFGCVHRARLLPSGGDLDPDAHAELARHVREALEAARRISRLHRTPVCETRWSQLYQKMADGPAGLAGAVTARAEAQCLRLSVTYALLDGAKFIDIEHLEAAYAVWQYCEASAAHVFGDRLGDDVADRLLEALKLADTAGLDGTAQREVFSGHVSGRRLAQARAELEQAGLAYSRTENTGGRPRVITYATCAQSAVGAKRVWPATTETPTANGVRIKALKGPRP